nr:MAG TPA: hypothetical protein [Crassvirales sp.]
MNLALFCCLLILKTLYLVALRIVITSLYN